MLLDRQRLIRSTIIHCLEKTKEKTIADSNHLGVSLKPLFKNKRESVRIETMEEANTEILIDAPGDVELLVIEESFREGYDNLYVRSWLRLPSDRIAIACFGDKGATV